MSRSWPRRPHTLGVDDGPFQKHVDRSVPIVAVMMEGPDLVEAVARTEFAADGDDATGFLLGWIDALRVRPNLHALFLGGITIAGLGVVDVERLSAGLGIPVVVVNRKDAAKSRVSDALRAARLDDRLPIVDRAPAAFEAGGIYLSCAGCTPAEARRWLLATRHKSNFPEPLRLAHLIAAAIARGQSRGRV